jgi:diguanylate cyclase (GGDEF)-like protein
LPQSGTERCSDAPRDLGWLCPTEADRARLLDMGPRVVRARTIALVATGAGAILAMGEVGWWAPVLFAVVIVNLGTLDRRIQRARRPERVVAATLLLILWLMAASAALTGGAASPVLSWLVIPVAVAAMRFRARVVWVITGFAALTAVVVAFIGGIQQAIDHPLIMIALFVLLIAVTAVTTALMDAELQFRGESVLDPLTGLLNRSGLAARFAEVREQARLLNRPVCLIMCDLDHFKRVNDEFGHERGDVVLREVSYEMRKSLRSFELFYRLGGEEFLVLLPGLDLPQGLEIAHSLRAAVAASRPGGLPITGSFGVSVATGGEIEFLALYRAADDAMYRAKAEGRNLVVAQELPIGFAEDTSQVAGGGPEPVREALAATKS